MAPSTFASAAAGNHSAQNPTRDAASEWSRRTNGATQTFRRASGATTSASAAAAVQPQQTPDAFPPSSARYVPPHRNGPAPSASSSDTRYSKEQLFELYRSQHSGLKDGLPGLFVGGWQPDGGSSASASNGAAAAPWGRLDSNRDVQPGADVCWDSDAGGEPLGLTEMDDEERELFTTSVNTPIKPPAATGKDGQATNGLPGRKTSVSASGAAAGGFGLPSPSVARGAGRRRDTNDSFPFPQNQAGSAGGFGRDEPRAASPPPSLLRRRTDIKDSGKHDDKDAEEKASLPFGSLKRNPTGPIGPAFGAPTSPWSTGPQSAGLSPMGTFGNFGLGSAIGPQGAPGEKRPGLGAGRTESRFKNLLSKDSQEDVSSRSVERKGSISGLAKVHENESWRTQDGGGAEKSEALDESEENVPAGSAALAADADISPPQHRQNYRGFGTPSRQGTQDEYGFGAFGMTANAGHGFGGPGFLPGRDAFQQTPAHQRGGLGGNEPMSPTDTNPYQSPDQHNPDRTGEDGEGDGNDLHGGHLPGLGGFGPDAMQQLGGLGGLGALPHGMRGPGPVGPASDRSQTSSVGPGRGFSGLGGLGQLGNVGGSGGWPVSQGGLGTPGRQTAGLSSAFSGGLFTNSMSDLHSPGGLAGLGGPGLMGPSGGLFGGSRMANVFTPDHLRHDEHERATQPFAGLGEIGRPGESPFVNQGFGEGQQDQGGDQGGQFGAPGQQLGQGEHSQGHLAGQSQPLGSSASSQPPAPQQRTMVMPDRMRWIYRDPQGQTQGPWSGLEMHDWYKAGFFSPELLVKKYEDQDYEPLAQLIRRIGNSREPFLVPQIGIPHGNPSGNGPNAWAGPGPIGGTGAAAGTGGAQPPFASSFPSFGTTLTADQQNALERRKQEEQYLMARQKEHLAQAQMSQRYQMQSAAAGGPAGLIAGQLHHHSSAHSLHSQPSFGSISGHPAGPPTAGGYQASPLLPGQPLGPGALNPHQPGFFDNSFRGGPPQPTPVGAIGSGVDALSQIREEEQLSNLTDRLNLGGKPRAPGQFGAPGQPFAGQQQQQQQQQASAPAQEAHEKQIQQMLQDRAKLQQEQAQQDDAAAEAYATNERLKQFEQLQQEQQAVEEKAAAAAAAAQQVSSQQASAAQSSIGSPAPEPLQPREQLVKEIAAAVKQQPEQGFPQPFPAPAVNNNNNTSPLAAPEPQRPGRPIVAEHLQKEPRDSSETPSVESKAAPWATKDPAEAPKGPSLKEIQEMEAKQAAKAEELALAARRAALQKAMEAEAQAAVVQPGLPAASNWAAASGSPSTPTGGAASSPAAWAKPAQKAAGGAGPVPAAKSMAQIQKEEEARKRKLAAAAATAQAGAMASVAHPAGGKSYANLAGKVSAAPASPATVGGGAWTTVGAGGKAKTPITTGPPPAVTSRAVSASVLPQVQAAAAAGVRKTPSRSSTLVGGAGGAGAGAGAGGVNALEEFKKWAANELRPDLSKGISAEDFVSSLTMLPPESDILTEAVHGVSSTLDSRHFAEEFLRRKKLADKGVVDSAPLKASGFASAAGYGAGADGKAGGWNEVAKKGPAGGSGKDALGGAAGKEDAAAAAAAGGLFRVVAAKKKGGKR